MTSAQRDPGAAAKIVTSFLAGQPLLTWPAEILNRFAAENDKPSLTEVAAVFGPLVDAMQLAPPDLERPLGVLVRPLHQIILQYKAAAEGAAGSGVATVDVSINIQLDPDAYRRGLLEVLQWLNEHGYKFEDGTDVPDTIPDDWA